MKIRGTDLLCLRTSSLLILTILFAASRANAQLGATVPNWPVPSSGSTSSGRLGGMRTLGDVTPPATFVGVTPCRIVDTRGPAGPFGAPALSAAVSRNFTLLAGPCTGFPQQVAAYSLNITVTNTLGPGFIKIYPQDGPVPVVSTVNYVAGQTVANAAIVPAGTGGGITVVAGVSGTDLVIDINGYFPNVFLNSDEALELDGTKDFDGVVAAVNNSLRGFGILGESFATTNEGAGVLGLSEGTTGRVFGVEGRLSSSTAGAAGVFGVDASGDPGVGGTVFTAGVWGASRTGLGVMGVSQVDAVKGVFMNSAGNDVTSGHLGHDGTNGVFAVGNVGATGAKTFIDPQPTQAGKAIVYVALEGPEAGTYFRGRGRIRDGTAVILVPESFRLVSSDEGLTVQVTPIGEAAGVAVVSADLNSIVVRSARQELEFFYTVNGVRKAFEGWDPMGQPDYFVPEGAEARMPAAFTAEQRQRLIANGTYNADGTVNMTTAERLGWTRIWQQREQEARARENAVLSSDRSNK
jgi:hypothetical protein